MPSIFTRIIAGEIPGRFVWKDARCVAILTIAPLRPGHALVIPREEIDHWHEADPALLAHLMDVARKVAKGIERAFEPTRVGLIIAGLEVQHLHIHVTPIWELDDLDFKKADQAAKPEDLDAAAERLRDALRGLGHGEVPA